MHNAFPSTGPPAADLSGAAGSVTFLLTAVEPNRATATGMVANSVMLVRLAADSVHTQVVFLPVALWLASARMPAGAVGGMLEDGGPERLIGALEAASGVRIDHYAQLDIVGFRTMTDAVGEVDVTIPARYVDMGDIFAPGRQHLDGTEAIAYLRAARAADHAGKAGREELVIEALFTRLGTMGTLSHLATMTRTDGAVTSALSVDSTLDDAALVRLARYHRNAGALDFLAAPVTGRGTTMAAGCICPTRSSRRSCWRTCAPTTSPSTSATAGDHGRPHRRSTAMGDRRALRGAPRRRRPERVGGAALGASR